MPIQAPAPALAASARMPLWVAAACAGLLVFAGAVAWWRSGSVAAPAVLALQPVQPVQPAQPVQAVQAVPAPVVVAPPVTVIQPAPLPVAVAPVAPPPVAVVKPAPVPVAAEPAAPPPVVKPPAPVAAPAPVPEAPPEENLPFMSQLPEPTRSEVPKVAFGGYMYSKNPADRLLLIDKVLRHEGEEVAPGLVLEQLQPKAAVMNYRGTRYRVAY
jgi:general secretion pathway protein B